MSNVVRGFERCFGGGTMRAMKPSGEGSPAGDPARASSVPEPPWRSHAQAARRVPLTRESILEAALRVLDRDGMDGLSMRRVAQELGTGPASLYWHVRNKGELLQLL